MLANEGERRGEMTIILLLLVVSLTCFGQVVLKARATFHAGQMGASDGPLPYLLSMFLDVWTIGALFAAFLAGVAWMLAIQRTSLVYAYPFVAMSFVIVPIASYVFLAERLGPMQIAGALIISLGVVVSAAAK